MHLLVRCLYTTYYQRLANVCYISVYNLATIVNNIHIYGISHLCIRTCRIHFKDTLVHFSFAINKIRFYITSRIGLIRIIFSTFLVIGFLLFPEGSFYFLSRAFIISLIFSILMHLRNITSRRGANMGMLVNSVKPLLCMNMAFFLQDASPPLEVALGA